MPFSVRSESGCVSSVWHVNGCLQASVGPVVGGCQPCLCGKQPPAWPGSSQSWVAGHSVLHWPPVRSIWRQNVCYYDPEVRHLGMTIGHLSSDWFHIRHWKYSSKNSFKSYKFLLWYHFLQACRLCQQFKCFENHLLASQCYFVANLVR